MWAKVDDGFWCHPKVIGLSLPATGLWVRALSWSCAQRCDTVPAAFLAMVGATDQLAIELTDAGLWNATPDGWRIHDWEEYQAKTTAERRAEAGRKGGLASGAKRSKREANVKQNTFAVGLLAKQRYEAGTHPDPTRPVPSTSSTPSATETVDACIDEAVRQRAATTTGIRNPKAWQRKVRAQIVDEENGPAQVARLLELYPNANTSQIAAALNGSNVALRLLPRVTPETEPATH